MIFLLNIRVCLDSAEMFVSAFFQIFFFTRFRTVTATVAAKFDLSKFDLSNHFQPISAHRALFTDPQISLFSNFFIKNESHEFHFSATFSLKMSLTVLFTYLKIILLQYFSVFSFSFQFSAVSKRTLNMNSSSVWMHNCS